MILRDIIIRNSRRYPDKLAFSSADIKYTFAQFNNRVNKVVNALAHLGVNKGDRIAVLADDCPFYPEIWWAAAKSGIVMVPLIRTLVGEDLIYIINNSQPNTLFYGDNYSELVNSVRPQLETVNNFIDGVKSYENLVSSQPPEEPKTELDEDDLFCITYTGGTTGLPKGVMLTHKNILANALGQILENRMSHEDILLTIYPYCHAGFIYSTFPPFYIGATVVGTEKFDAETILKTIESNKVTIFYSSTDLLAPIITYPHIDRYNLSSLRRIIYAGAPIPVEILKRGLKHFGKIFAQSYGLSECFVLTYLLPEEYVVDAPLEKVKRLGSCGREAINTKVKVVNESGEDVAPGEVGEIIGRGDEVMKGYWRMPEATSQAIKNGYIYTGDMATVDETGYIYMTGRKKDMIITGGKTIFPREIEEVIYRHPCISEAAVIGMPSKELGESVKAFVVSKRKMSATAEEIIKFCRQNLVDYAVPQSVEFVNQLPRNPMGKVLRRVLREEYSEQKKRD